MARSLRKLVLPFLVAGIAPAGTFLRTSGNPVRWTQGRVALRVSRAVHMAGGDTGVDRRETAASVHVAVFEAVRAWNRAGAGIQIDIDFSDAAGISGTENLITFTDTAPYDSGLCDPHAFVACTVLAHGAGGEILSVEIAFNPYKKHSSIGLAGTHDIGLLAMHEIGHALGLDHTAVLDSVMNFQVELEPAPGAAAPFAVRELSFDDRQTLLSLYRAGEFSTLQGTVRRASDSISGAHVVAVDTSGRPVHGTITAEDGSYELVVPPGDYRLAVEPLDGPTLPGEVRGLTVGAPFPTLWWTVAGGSGGDGEAVRVEAGQARVGLDFAVPDGPVVNAESIGIIQNGVYLGFSRVAVARGRDYLLGITRSPAAGAASLSLPRAPVMLDGPATVPASAPQLVRQRIRVPSAAALGSYVVHYTGDGAGSLLAGALRIVGNPVVASMRDAATGETVAACGAGQIVSIVGSDLAPATSAAEVLFEGAPRPVQREGVSVRIGDRLAPLVAVSPGEIVVEIPAGVKGTVALAVVTGAGVESPAREIHVE